MSQTSSSLLLAAGRTVMVTGGAGFIGSHLAEALLARGNRVIALDDLSSDRTANLPLSHERLRFVEARLGTPTGDAAFAQALDDILRDCFEHIAAVR